MKLTIEGIYRSRECTADYFVISTRNLADGTYRTQVEGHGYATYINSDTLGDAEKSVKASLIKLRLYVAIDREYAGKSRRWGLGAFEAGFRAAFSGKHEGDCPYQGEGGYARKWAAGFSAAMAVMD